MSTIDTVERRKRIIINIIYVVMLLGLMYLFLKYAFWLFAPFIFAFFIAMILQRPINFIVRKTPLKKGIVSGVLVLLIVCLVGFIISLIGIKITNELKGLVSFLMSKVEDIPLFLESLRDTLLEKIKILPDGIEKSLSASITEFSSKLLTSSAETTQEVVSESQKGGTGLLAGFDFSILSAPVSGVLSTAKQIPSILVATIIGIVACCFMTSDYDRLVNFVKRQFSPEKRKALSTSKGLFVSSLKQLGKSYLTIICITFVEMFLGLNVLKLIGVYNSGYIVSLALIIAIVDIFPVLGTGTVLVPWAIISLLMGHIGLGIGLIVIYAVISVIRQIVEPKLVAANLGLPPVVTIMGMYLGLQLFGFIGIFAMPIIIIMVKLLNDQGIIHIWRSSSEAKAADIAAKAAFDEEDVQKSIVPDEEKK